jgi:hypothetical protein
MERHLKKSSLLPTVFEWEITGLQRSIAQIQGCFLKYSSVFCDVLRVVFIEKPTPKPVSVDTRPHDHVWEHKDRVTVKHSNCVFVSGIIILYKIHNIVIYKNSQWTL